MRICFLGDYHSVHTLRWTRFFVPRHEVHLISLAYSLEEAGKIKPEDYENLGIKLHLIPRKGIINKLRGPSRVKRLLSAIDPDIVHAHYLTHYGYLAAKADLHPLIMTAWGTDVLIEADSTFFKSHQVKYALKNTDFVTCDGENTSIALKNFISMEKIRKIYFGVDTVKISPERRIEGFYDEYKKNKLGKTVINIRGFAEIYDPDTFIGAILPIVEKAPDTIFIMARESDRRGIYEEMVRDLGIQSNVKFIGNISSEDLPTYLASADIYVSTSLSDSGIAASTAEAMASGIAVISTNVGDASYWIVDGMSGFIIPKGDSQALSERILYLLSNDEVRKEVGREARKVIETGQDYRKEMTKMEQLYESLVKETRK